MPATWRELLTYLRGLESDTRLFETGDNRLDDTIIIRDNNGEYYPAEFLEFEGDDIMDDGHIILVPHEWGETFEETID